MSTTGNTTYNSKNNVWIISEGKPVDLNLKNITFEEVSGPVTEHRISDIARYLLNPKSIEIEEYVVGCKVHRKVPPSGLLKRVLNKLTFWKKVSPNDTDAFVEDILLTTKLAPPHFKTDSLNHHLIRIKEQLMPFKPIQKKLSALHENNVDEITATGEGIDKNRYQIELQGSIKDKVNFVLNSLTNKAKMTIKKSYVHDGLFDFRGYNFTFFDTQHDYPLIKCSKDNQTKYCVLTRDYLIDYWVDDIKLINYLHLFEQSIQTDPGLKDALQLCVKGQAKPLKLFFTEKYEQSYSEKNLPMTYRNMLYTHNIAPDEIEVITSTLNNNQSIVFFDYVPITDVDQTKLFTVISILHDLNALDSVKEHVPRIYSEITQKTTDSEAGKLYLLDSMRGSQDV